MKKVYWMVPLAALCVMPFAVRGAKAASRSLAEAPSALDAPSSVDAGGASQGARVARATANFDNTRYDRAETAWGRFVADAIRDRSGADIALVNAGALERGTLRAGDVHQDDISDLLSFGNDDVATLQLTGAQLRAALERAVGTVPTGSPAWLHVSGLTATFNAAAKPGSRITSLQVGGRAVDAGDSFRVAMPVGLAEGASGYYKVWGNNRPNVTANSVLESVVAYARRRGDISPDANARVRAG